MKLTFSIFLSFIFLSCNPSNKTPLVVYSPHGKDMLQEFAKRFEKTHPDVDVQWLDMGSQDAYDRIRTEKENPQADVWWGAPSTMFIRAAKESLLAAYKPTWADDVAPENKSAHDFWYGTFATPEVIAFNSRLLSAAQAPKDWDDLLDPRWKGKIILRYPLASGTLRIIFSSIIARSVKAYGTGKEGFEWLQRLDANTEAYTPDPTQMYLRLAREEAEVTLWDMPDIVFQAEINHYPFGYNFPKSGTVSLTDGIAIVRGCKHEKLAEEFYEFVTSKESLILQARKFYRIPARGDIPRDSLPSWITSTHFTSMPIDWSLISQHESEWMEKWDAEVKGKGNR
ncbi:MAG: extracellular solute-binding protein [Bacteroidota bacterium]|nr:extracellular solute-binding protein [Bacteroidota bacterium]